MKALGIALMILGALLGIGGAAAPAIGSSVAVGKVNDTDSTTYVEGVLPRLLNTSKVVADPTNPYDTNVPIEQMRVTQSNAEAMAQQDAKDAGASIFNTTATTTRTDTGDELSVSEAQYAFNPETSELINCCGASVGGNTDVEFSGVMPLKFPFNAPEGDVQLWNDTVQAPVTAKFVETVEEYGMTLNKYQISIPVTQTPAPPLEVPAALAVGLATQLAPQLVPQIPAEGNVGLYDFYQAESTYLVEPLTGQIVDGRTVDKTTLRLDGGTEDIVTKVETDAGSTNVEEGAAEIKASADQLKTVDTAGTGGLGGGALAFLSGLGLTIAGSRKKKKQAEEAAAKPAVTSQPKSAAPAAAAPAAAATAAGAAKAAQPDAQAKAADLKAQADAKAAEARKVAEEQAAQAKKAAEEQAAKAQQSAPQQSAPQQSAPQQSAGTQNVAEKAADDAKAAADRAGDDVAKAADDVAGGAKDAADDVAKAADDVAGDAKSATDDLMNKAKDAGDDVKNAAEDLFNKAKDQFGGGSSGGTTGGGNPTT